MAKFEADFRDEDGDLVPAASVKVSSLLGLLLADLFSDEEMTIATPNPATVDRDGVIKFYVAGGIYDLLIQRSGIENRTISNVEIGSAVGPVGPAGGDLDSAYPDPEVVKIRGLDVTSGAPADAAIARWDETAGEIQWSTGSGPATDPRKLVLPPALFKDTGNNVFHNVAPVLSSGIVLTGIAGLLFEEAAGLSTHSCTIKLPDPYYNRPVNYSVIANRDGATAGESARLAFDIQTSTPLTILPVNRVTVPLNIGAVPELHLLGQLIPVPGPGGFVHVTIGRDWTHPEDTLSGAFNLARIFSIILEPA